MRPLVRLAFVSLLIAAPAVTGAAQYHAPTFLVGGSQLGTSSEWASGLWIVDGTRRTAVSLFAPHVRPAEIRVACMDVDNRCIMFVAKAATWGTIHNVQDGVFRYDPDAQTITTIFRGNYTTLGPAKFIYGMTVNQDGDYVFGAEAQEPTVRDYRIYKVGASRTLTTVLSTLRDIHARAEFTGAMGRNIDTGNYLALTNSVSGPFNWNYPVLDVDEQGRWTVYSNGGGSHFTKFGWMQRYGHLHQDYETGDLQIVMSILGKPAHVYRLKPGSTPRTTLWALGHPYGFTYQHNAPGIPDLQSAARRRYVVPAYYYQPSQPGKEDAYWPAYTTVDQENYLTTGHVCPLPENLPTRYGPTYNLSLVFEFYRNRHIASVKTGEGKWTLLFSVPNHPGKQYKAIVGTSGVRPPLALPDGRRLCLKFDVLSHLSMHGLLGSTFDPGPGQLDAKGEARGQLDVSAFLPTGGLPIWIAMVVLDPNAPLGIAYIPNPHVIRVP